MDSVGFHASARGVWTLLCSLRLLSAAGRLITFPREPGSRAGGSVLCLQQAPLGLGRAARSEAVCPGICAVLLTTGELF